MAPRADRRSQPATPGGGELQPAWLLHRRPFRNTSLIVDLFTPHQGRLSAVVRGGQKDPLWSPFRPLWVSLKASGELYTLTKMEPRGAPMALHGTALYCGFYVNELVMRLIHRDAPVHELWHLYSETLETLHQSPLQDVVLRHFELALLDELGFGIDLSVDALGDPLSPDAHYRLDLERGLIRANHGYAGAELLQLDEQPWDKSTRRLAKLLCREMLTPHLQGRPLKSRELFRQRQ